MFIPYDMEYGLPNDIKMYSLIGDIVSTLLQAASDNGGPSYLKGAYGLLLRNSADLSFRIR
jgi:hypothetical protein